MLILCDYKSDRVTANVQVTYRNRTLANRRDLVLIESITINWQMSTKYNKGKQDLPI